MKKRIIIGILIFLILLTASICLGIYFLPSHTYIKIKYGENISIEEKNIKDDLSLLQVSDNINNYIRTVTDYINVGISKSGLGISKIYKNGHANFKFYIDEAGNVVVEIINIFDSNSKSYLEELEVKEFIINIKDDNAKYLTYHDKYLYILTEKGNLYSYLLNKSNDTLNLENELFNIANNFPYVSITNKNITEIINYYNDDEKSINGRIYALLDNGDIINVLTGKKFNEEEQYVSTFRFGNARIAINRDASIQYCHGHDQFANPCSNDYLGNIITDNEGKIITIYALITYNKHLYIIDTNGNIYSELFDNQNHTVIETVTKHNNKKVESIMYIYDNSEKYLLKELIINYSNKTRETFEDISRLSIYNIN